MGYTGTTMVKKSSCDLKIQSRDIIEEVHHINSAPTATTYNKIDKLNLDPPLREQQGDSFCKRKTIEIKAKPDLNFILDDNSILRKAVKLRYSVRCTIIVPRNLANIILEFHIGKDHQGISHSVNMMQRYFWWIECGETLINI